MLKGEKHVKRKGKFKTSKENETQEERLKRKKNDTENVRKNTRPANNEGNENEEKLKKSGKWRRK